MNPSGLIESDEEEEDVDMREMGDVSCKETLDGACKEVDEWNERNRRIITLRAFCSVLEFCHAKNLIEEKMERSVPKEQLYFSDSFPEDRCYTKLFFDPNTAVSNPDGRCGEEKAVEEDTYPQLFATFDSEKFARAFKRYRARTNPAVRQAHEVPRFDPFEVETIMKGLISGVQKLSISNAAPSDPSPSALLVDKSVDEEDLEVEEEEEERKVTFDPSPMVIKFDNYVTSLNAIPLLLPISPTYLLLVRDRGGGRGLEKAYVTSVYTVCSLKSLFHAELRKRKADLNVRIKLLENKTKQAKARFAEEKAKVDAPFERPGDAIKEGEEKRAKKKEARKERKKAYRMRNLENRLDKEYDAKGHDDDILDVSEERKFLNTVESRFIEDLDWVMKECSRTVDRIAETYAEFILSLGTLSNPIGREEEDWDNEDAFGFVASRCRYAANLYRGANYRYWIGLIRAHERACINLFLYDRKTDKELRNLCINPHATGDRTEEEKESCEGGERSPHYFEDLLTKNVVEQGSINDINGLGSNNVDLGYFDYRRRSEHPYNSTGTSFTTTNELTGVPLAGIINATVRFSTMTYALKYERTPQGIVSKRRWWESPDLENGDDPSFQAARSSDGYRAGLYYDRIERAASERLKTQGLQRVERELKEDGEFRKWWKCFKGEEEEEEEPSSSSSLTTTTTTTETTSTFIEETMRRECRRARIKASILVKKVIANPKLISKLEKEQESQVYHVPIGEVHDFLMLQWLVLLYEKTLIKAEELYPPSKPAVDGEEKKKEEGEEEKWDRARENMRVRSKILQTADPSSGRNAREPMD